jgi:hypothetical protein
MCKINIPQLPSEATDDERRSAYFDALLSLDMSDKVEKRENLTYLSWANAWSELKSCYPSATYEIVKNKATGLPYFSDPETGIMIFTHVTVDSVTHEMWLPVMDNRNKAMKLQPYNYQAWDSYKKAYVEKTVQAATMFDINKTLMRCLVKNLAMFGLGLYIYAGEDIPGAKEETAPSSSTPRAAATPKPVDRLAGIKNIINNATDVNTLISLYLDHQAEIEANPEIKTLLTERKNQLQNH